MESVQATRLRKGMLIKMNANLFRVLELNHVTPGNKRGFVQSKMRNIRTGTQTDHKFSSGDYVERALLDSRKMQFLYADGEGYHFMDTESTSRCTWLVTRWVTRCTTSFRRRPSPWNSSRMTRSGSRYR